MSSFWMFASSYQEVTIGILFMKISKSIDKNINIFVCCGVATKSYNKMICIDMIKIACLLFIYLMYLLYAMMDDRYFTEVIRSFQYLLMQIFMHDMMIKSFCHTIQDASSQANYSCRKTISLFLYKFFGQ